MAAHSWIRNLFAGKASKAHVSADRRGLSRKPKRTHLRLEALEDRLAPATLGTYSAVEGPALGNDSVVLANTTAWTATSNTAFLHITTGSASGTGNAVVKYSFDANSGATRSGTLSIAGLTLTVTQAGSTYVAAQPTLVASGLNTPEGVAVDGAGNVYIADSSNNAIKE